MRHPHRPRRHHLPPGAGETAWYTRQCNVHIRRLVEAVAWAAVLSLVADSQVELPAVLCLLSILSFALA